jgi:hypothetical protein
MLQFATRPTGRWYFDPVARRPGSAAVFAAGVFLHADYPLTIRDFLSTPFQKCKGAEALKYAIIYEPTD